MIETLIAAGLVSVSLYALTVLPVRMMAWLINDSHLAFRDEHLPSDSE